MADRSHGVTRDFISEEPRNYRFKIGQIVASSLSGFIAGIVFATVAFLIILKYYEMFHPQ